MKNGIIKKSEEVRMEEYLHLQKVLQRKSEIALQKIDNQIVQQEVIIPKVVEKKVIKDSKWWIMFFKQVLP